MKPWPIVLLLLAADEHPLSSEQREKLDKGFQEIIAEAGKTLKTDPKNVDACSSRGDALFMRGKFAEALADYEKMVEVDPKLDAGHWRRGIAYFYAGQFGKAAGQFERYHSFDNVDRENGIWRYFSQRKAFGKAKAQEGLLKYEKDDREPFPDVYQIFQGKKTPEEILAKISSAPVPDGERDSRLFYAHLYIGLNFAVEDKPDAAIPHLRKAVASPWAPTAGYGPAYMWHVGRLHYDLLTRPKKD
jgi:lipoprotein NlpI